MEQLSSLEIRDRFLSFFKEKDHMEITDSSVIPKNDPTLLFINSGMAPIKNYFIGVEQPPYPRLCDVQSCIRTIDIDSIGDKHHLTSFQMLGSWSINNYFKEHAIALAFEFLVERLGIPKSKLYVTVFSGDSELGIPCDDEAYECWKKVGVPENHIIKCGKDDNFWGPTAATGPCGPCTEVFFDTGEGEEYQPGGIFDTKKRYIEIWNAGVFMQFNKNADGSFSKLGFKSVDTGAGLERLSMVLTGCESVYETDLLRPIKNKIKEQIGKNIDMLPDKDISIMTDHLRTICLILSEKVSPSNEGRGYIPRKLIRRCMMIVAKHKALEFDFSEVIEFILESYKNIFYRFVDNKLYILDEFKREHNKFKKVLDSGLERLEAIKSGSNEISADEAFELVTTYGMPIDIIKVYASENDLKLDESGFEAKLEEHREKSRYTSNSSEKVNVSDISNVLKICRPTKFFGYNSGQCDSEIMMIIQNGERVQSAKSGENVAIVLSDTSFYAESGGQCADTGVLKAENFEVEIYDVQKTSEGVFAHFGKVTAGEFRVGDQVKCIVDDQRRLRIANNHSAVHLLQSALQKLYGKNVHQSGSKVEPDRLRFDFNYENTITEQDISELEKTVNKAIRDNIERKIEIMDVHEAMRGGAMALFESKYGDTVRVVSFGDVSSELCGGIHTDRTGNIGMFVITGAEGIGKGIKRITAITGQDALEFVRKHIKNINDIAKFLKVKPEGILEKLQKDSANKLCRKKESKTLLLDNIRQFSSKKIDFCGYIELEEGDKKIVSEVGKLADKSGKLLICIVGTAKKQIIIAVPDTMTDKIMANKILGDLMLKIGGKGGGNKKIATCGADAKNEDILSAVAKIL